MFLPRFQVPERESLALPPVIPMDAKYIPYEAIFPSYFLTILFLKRIIATVRQIGQSI
jgi:hypothetical protein